MKKSDIVYINPVMCRKLEFLLAIITVVFMTICFITSIYVFAQIGATVALINLLISTIRCSAEYDISKKEENE